MDPTDWRPYQADDDSFEVRPPPGVELTSLPGQPPGQTYLYAATPGDKGTFSVLRGPVAAIDPAAILDLERERGAQVTVLADEAVERDGLPAHQLHFRSAEVRPPELLEDPATGDRVHHPGGPRTTEAEYIFWRGRGEAVRAGYRLDGEDPSALALLRAMLAGFHLRRPPP